jgi:hypothetical protein
MDEIITSELKRTKSSAASASVEKTLEYETEEGKVREKSTMNYNVDKGNAIDNIVNTVIESKSVEKAGSFINKTIRLGVSGGGGIMAAAGTYEVAKNIYRSFVTGDGHGKYGEYVWDVPAPTVIGGSILVGFIASYIIFTIYSNMFIKK